MRRLPFPPARKLPAAAVAALVLVPLISAATAVAATHMGHAGPRRVAPPASLAHSAEGHRPTTTTRRSVAASLSAGRCSSGRW